MQIVPMVTPVVFYVVKNEMLTSSLLVLITTVFI